MVVKYIDEMYVDVTNLSELFDREGIQHFPISEVNWPEEYPYRPDVRFRMAHNGSSIMVEYIVKEDHVRAMAGMDNWHVWEDSCVEMFIAFDDSHYYNIECNCVGKVLLACGPDRNERMYSSQEQVGLIRRSPSIPDIEPFDNRNAPEVWSMRLVVPVKAFFNDDIQDLRGKAAKANFYKCGDKLPVPHFLSWRPIRKPIPDFHLPEYFGEIVFE
ncbi:carbohydrate-binding family 9-like protein [uncultured Muribaculum sp.]|uniref:carbohydrate-binding family 9-like protein n=1 Tax=uncultured Muribaculum sp. TaxID=1918613 RepID=UPI0025DE4365|nr:carbohydrate-binding family 9-like protein [uncultured Muribaculum sp.]